MDRSRSLRAISCCSHFGKLWNEIDPPNEHKRVHAYKTDSISAIFIINPFLNEDVHGIKFEDSIISIKGHILLFPVCVWGGSFTSWGVIHVGTGLEPSRKKGPVGPEECWKLGEAFCFLLLSVAVLEHHGQTQVGKQRAYFILHTPLRLLSITKSSYWNRDHVSFCLFFESGFLCVLAVLELTL